MVVIKKTHKGWTRNVKNIKPFFNKISTGYIIPSSIARVGSRGYRCESKNSSLCKAYCCSLDVELNPLEIAIISFHTRLPPIEFVDYCENSISVCKTGNSYISPLFAFKKSNEENSRCIFNQADFKCGIYEFRPIVCRAMPYFFDNELKQKKTCAGYKCGTKISKQDFKDICQTAKAAKVLSKTGYLVDFEDWADGNHKKILEETFQKTELPFYEPVSVLEPWNILEKIIRFSNFEKKLKQNKITQKEIVELVLREISSRNLEQPITSEEKLEELIVIDEEAQC